MIDTPRAGVCAQRDGLPSADIPVCVQTWDGSFRGCTGTWAAGLDHVEFLKPEYCS